MVNTLDFPQWRQRFGALKAKVKELRAYSLSQLEEVFEGIIPAYLLSQSDEGPNSRQRVFSVRVTFWGFLYQCLKPKTSCREVVRQVQALFAVHGQRKVDEDDSAYCQARGRIKQEALEPILQATAQAAERKSSLRKWFGREVKVVDATTTSLADTAENQAQYPQSQSQAPGCGFPIMKLAALMSLASGAVIAVAKGNKHDHELSLLRRLYEWLKSGDILLGDDSFSDYATLASLKMKGVDALCRLQGRRKKDFRWGKKLGKADRLISLAKPAQKTRTVDAKTWEALPAFIEVRLIRLQVPFKGFRTKQLDLITALTDEKQYPAHELAALFYRRWRLELCFRDLKTTMAMEEMRTKSPEMVHKELAMYLIAHNLIRCLMAEAAAIHEADLEQISFKGTVDSLRQYSAALAQARNKKQRSRLKQELLENLARDLLPYRPNRTEPRAKKRRPKPFPILNKPRKQFKEIPHRSRYKKKAA